MPVSKLDKSYRPFLLHVSLLLAVLTSAAQAACPPPAYSKEDLLEIRQAGFEMADDAQRNALALSLLDCVGDPDAQLRDGVAFEGISSWLRAEKLDAETYFALYLGLLEQLDKQPDVAGFRQPFAALILSEVARADRIQMQLSEEQRDRLVNSAADYLASVRDYRGFSKTEGWRHGVAHGADLALQLVLNPTVNEGQVKTLLEAVAAQLAPIGDVFYIYGEPSRLARVVFYSHQRGLLDNAYWQAWFDGVASPQPMLAWSEAFASQPGLAKRHNVLAFLQVMHLNSSLADNEKAAELDLLVMSALRKVLN
jgi:hypothetical protein